MTYSNSKNTDLEIAIIGAGLAGVSAAAALEAAGMRVKLFEKSRGVGGRLATRQTRDGLEFDHGAQYFTARSDSFRQALATPPMQDAVAMWQAGERAAAPSDAGSDTGAHNRPSTWPNTWHVGAPMMKSPALALAQSLDIRLKALITDIERCDGRWILSGEGLKEDGAPARESADIVIVSAPAPQAKALTGFSQSLQAALSKVEIEPCWALMAAFHDPSADDHADAPATVIKPKTGPFSWIAQNSAKPGRNQLVETWVAHASPAWSAQYIEMEKEAAVEALLPEFLAHIDQPDRAPDYVMAHRWRYARVAKAAEAPFLVDETGALFAIGDWCLGPRVECAFESGYAVADHIIRTQH